MYRIALLCVCLVAACSDDDEKESPGPKIGDLGGPCYGNDTCNPGFECADALCAPEVIEEPEPVDEEPAEGEGEGEGEIPESACPGDPEVRGHLANRIADIDYDDTFAKVRMGHRIDADLEEDGCIASLEVRLTTFEGRGCELALVFSASESGLLMLSDATLDADAFCPGWGPDDVGVFSFIEGTASLTGPVRVPGRLVDEALVECEVFGLQGHATLRAPGRERLEVDLGNLGFRGSVTSYGDPELVCPFCATDPDADCQPDADGDGLLDEVDSCPDLDGFAQDRDRDCVVDAEDRCPDNPLLQQPVLGFFLTGITLPAGDGPEALAWGDLDGDGNADLVVANRYGGDVSVFLGAGDGSFAEPTAYPSPSPRDLSLGDLDNDGVLDLVVANSTDGNIRVHRGVGDGSFAAGVSYPASEAVSMALGDVNGDGNLDLAVANRGVSVSLHLGRGDGTLAGGVRFGAGLRTRSVALGDLDGDAVLDLAVANAGSEDVTVSLGIGDGTFAAPLAFGVGSLPVSVIAGDIDSDGAPDLVVASYDDELRTLAGLGDGTFTSAITHAGGQGPHAVAVGDLDQDGDLDMVVANRGGADISVYMGVGGGRFDAPSAYPAGDGPAAVALADANGDGTLDIAIANNYSDDLTVYLGDTDGCRDRGLPGPELGPHH